MSDCKRWIGGVGFARVLALAFCIAFWAGVVAIVNEILR